MRSGERISKLQIGCKGNQAEYQFGEGGLIKKKDLLGCIAEYGYTDGNLSLVKLDQYGEVKYDYDNQRRLQAMYYPDESHVEYLYADRKLSPEETGILLIETIKILKYPVSEEN